MEHTEHTAARNATLNALIDGDHPARAPYGPFGSMPFTPSSLANGVHWHVVAWNAEANLGLMESERTGYTLAFELGDDASPRKSRDYRAERHLRVFEIETVAPDGIILGALGARRTGEDWRIVA